MAVRVHGHRWSSYVLELMPELRARADDRCELCGRPVDFEAAPRTRWAPSVDHVIPLHAGGQVCPPVEELRLAHVGCNSRRGARTRARQRQIVRAFVTTVELYPSAEFDSDLPLLRRGRSRSYPPRDGY